MTNTMSNYKIVAAISVIFKDCRSYFIHFVAAIWCILAQKCPKMQGIVAAISSSVRGAYPRPGEVSLAHGGILFLDEFPEFKKNVLEMLRQPLEDGQVSISRAALSLTYPADFMLVAAMNPCPCGFLGDLVHDCSCPPAMLQRYRGKLSGPLLDRIDLHVEVPRVSHKDLTDVAPGESSSAIRQRVNQARDIQRRRLAPFGLYANSQMQARHIRRFCKLDSRGNALLEQVTDKLGLSARSYTRILKLARTIADLAQQEQMTPVHLSEAIQYRGLDRKAY